MQEATIRDALKMACKSSIKEATMHAQLIESQLMYLEQLGDLADGGLTLYDQARRVRPQDVCLPPFYCLLPLVATEYQRPVASLPEWTQEFEESVWGENKYFTLDYTAIK